MRIRDASTGRYISEEEANERTPDTWVIEKDEPTKTSSDLTALYKEIYDTADWDATKTWMSDKFRTIDLETLRKLFEKYGM